MCTVERFGRTGTFLVHWDRFMVAGNAFSALGTNVFVALETFLLQWERFWSIENVYCALERICALGPFFVH